MLLLVLIALGISLLLAILLLHPLLLVHLLLLLKAGLTKDLWLLRRSLTYRLLDWHLRSCLCLSRNLLGGNRV